MLTLTFEAVSRRHRAVLLDAYGVLVDAHGAIAGAAEGVSRLEAEGIPYLVVTNDASRSPERASSRFQKLGIPIGPERVLSSGMMIARYVDAHGLRGATAVSLGSGDSERYVREAGLDVIDLDANHVPDVVALCDESGFDFLPTMNELLSALLRADDAGRKVHLLLANPDLLYPQRAGYFGFTAGSLAVMLEAALALRCETPAGFVALGKPATMIFEEAVTRLGTRDAVMVGDQLHTDVAGAKAAGLAAALTTTGITSAEAARRSKTPPDYLLNGLA